MSAGNDPATRRDSEVGTADFPTRDSAPLEREPVERPPTPDSGRRPAGEPGVATTNEPGTATPNMLPGRKRRRFGIERLIVRLVANCGVVGIGVGVGAILAASKVQGWIIGLVIAALSVVLSAVLWSSRQL